MSLQIVNQEKNVGETPCSHALARIVDNTHGEEWQNYWFCIKWAMVAYHMRSMELPSTKKMERVGKNDRLIVQPLWMNQRENNGDYSRLFIDGDDGSPTNLSFRKHTHLSITAVPYCYIVKPSKRNRYKSATFKLFSIEFYLISLSVHCCT